MAHDEANANDGAMELQASPEAIMAHDEANANDGAMELQVSPGRVVAHDEAGADDETLVLPLPTVPATLVTPADRAAYIILHFWDALDFRDTLRSHNRAFMEQNIVNCLSLFPHAKADALPPGIDALMQRAAVDTTALHLVCDLAEQYLGERESPMRNEDHRILFLEALLRLPMLTADNRARHAYELQMARKNRPGTIATNFTFTDREGRRRTLYDTLDEAVHAAHGDATAPHGDTTATTAAHLVTDGVADTLSQSTAPRPRVLLLFYDPACSHCEETLNTLRESTLLRRLTANKQLTVVAVDVEVDRQQWVTTKDTMPQQWVVGFDESNIMGRGLYSLTSLPVLYLLDERKTVVLKDPTPAQLDAFLSR